MSIPFTQYLRPDGRRVSITTERPQPIEAMADAVIAAGLTFTAEELLTGHVNLTVEHPEDGDLFGEVVRNGPDVPAAVDRLVEAAFASLQGAA